jgi:hypothetical protein
MAKVVTANSDIVQLPDALTLPTRELVETLVETLREAMALREKQAVDEHRDALDARRLSRASRFLDQLERTLPPVDPPPTKQ